jgi:hypothetical protein
MLEAIDDGYLEKTLTSEEKLEMLFDEIVGN